MTDRHDIWQLAHQIQMDLRAAQAKLVELRSQLANLNLPTPTEVTCEPCGLKLRGPRTLAEHIHTSHGGPIPEHWQQLDQRVQEPA
jgi:hypothetical protein